MVQAKSLSLLRELLTMLVNTLMSAEADAVCGAAYGTTSPERVNRRNGYRPHEFDNRAGTLELAVPKLRIVGETPLDLRARSAACLVDHLFGQS